MILAVVSRVQQYQGILHPEVQGYTCVRACVCVCVRVCEQEAVKATA